MQKVGAAYMHWLMVAGHGSADLIEAVEACAAGLIVSACTLHLALHRALTRCARLAIAGLLSCASSTLFAVSLLWHAAHAATSTGPLWWLWLRPEVVGVTASVLATLIFLATRALPSLRPWVFPWDAPAHVLAPARKDGAGAASAFRGAVLYPVDSRAYALSGGASAPAYPSAPVYAGASHAAPPPPYHVAAKA